MWQEVIKIWQYNSLTCTGYIKNINKSIIKIHLASTNHTEFVYILKFATI